MSDLEQTFGFTTVGRFPTVTSNRNPKHLVLQLPLIGKLGARENVKSRAIEPPMAK